MKSSCHLLWWLMVYLVESSHPPACLLSVNGSTTSRPARLVLQTVSTDEETESGREGMLPRAIWLVGGKVKTDSSPPHPQPGYLLRLLSPLSGTFLFFCSNFGLVLLLCCHGSTTL